MFLSNRAFEQGTHDQQRNSYVFISIAVVFVIIVNNNNNNNERFITLHYRENKCRI